MSTNSFPRELNGCFAENDIYIDCYKGIKIFLFSEDKEILQVYCPSIQRGRNIIKTIEPFHRDIIFDIEQTDSELLFKFNAKYMEDLEQILRPKTSGANISPFSSRNLPKTAYKISESELLTYKEICSKIPEESRILLPKYTQSFIKSLANKRNSWENIKADMALKGLRGKEYIHSIGKWNDYIKYLQGAINGSK